MKITQKQIMSNLLMYAKYIKPDFLTPPHIVKIAKILNEFVFGDLDRLIITMPPRHGKSFLCSELLPTFILGNMPDAKIITASYGYGLSQNFSREVIKIMRLEAYRALFPNSIMSNNVDSGTFYTTKDGHYLSTSRGGTITGLGGNFIILDDLIKNSTEAKSNSILLNMQDWYDSTLYSRLLPGGKILFLQTRWSYNDLIGYIKKHDDLNEWKLINFPALDEDTNTALWPEMYSTKYLLDIKNRNDRQFQCLYQGNPSQEGTFKPFNLNDYQILRSNELDNKNIIYKFSSWDTASKTDAKHCFTAGTLWGVTFTKEIVLLDHIKFKKIIPQTKSLIKKQHDIWDCRYTLIEDADSGVGIIQELKPKMGGSIIPIQADVKKKLTDVVEHLEDWKAILSNIDEVLTELDDYPDGEYSDSVASVVNAIWWWKHYGSKRSVGGNAGLFKKSARNSNPTGRRKRGASQPRRVSTFND